MASTDAVSAAPPQGPPLALGGSATIEQPQPQAQAQAQLQPSSGVSPSKKGSQGISPSPTPAPMPSAGAAAAAAAPAPAAGAARVYLATYSSVPVYELTVRGIAVMRRRFDAFLNATQILKVAGVDKSRRTKVLEREILSGEHEKVQGGYGKFQGTWIPLQRAKELSAQYGVEALLQPLLEFDPASSMAAGLTAAPKTKRPNPNAPAAQRAVVVAAAAAAAAAQKEEEDAAATSAAPTSQADTEQVIGLGIGPGAGAQQADAPAQQQQQQQQQLQSQQVEQPAAVVDTSFQMTQQQQQQQQQPQQQPQQQQQGSDTSAWNGAAAASGSGSGSGSGPSQHPRFLRLRPPPATGAVNDQPLQGAFLDVDGGGAEEAETGGAAAAAAAAAAVNGNGNGRRRMRSAEEAESQGTAGSRNVSPTKRARIDDAQDEAMELDTPSGGAASLAGFLSPVKDLNNLGPAGGSFRASAAAAAAASGGDGSLPPNGSAHHHPPVGPGSGLQPRSARIVLGPPDELLRGAARGARYADRAQAFKGADESQERPIKEILTNLFLHGELGGKEGDVNGAAAAAEGAGAEQAHAHAQDEEKLKALLGKLSAAISLGAQTSAGPAAAAHNADNPNVSVNVIIDDHGHAPLHWAAALSELALVRVLLARPVEGGGANVHAGNFAGETALHRSVLVTNSYDAGAFPRLLTLLAPSIATRDYKRRTILHHIAMVAALRGRAASARYYLACVLEHIAEQQRLAAASTSASGGASPPPPPPPSAVSTAPGAAELINAQDEDGETALGIVARIGNASMVRMLLEVGARKDLVNNFGIRPSDWGIEQHRKTGNKAAAAAGSTPVEELATTRNEDVVGAIGKPPRPPTHRSEHVLSGERASR